MKKNLVRFAYLLLPVTFLLAIYYVVQSDYLSLNFIKMHMSEFRTYYADQPALTLGIYFFTYVMIAALAVPGAAILTLLGGALFGLIAGTVVVSFASTIGSTFAFLLARYFFKEKFLNTYGSKIKSLNQNLSRNGSAYLFFLRLNPVLPFFMINSLMGLTPMGTWTFFFISQIGMFPGTLLYVNAGTQLAQVQSAADIVSWEILLSFFLLGLFPLAMQLGLRFYRSGNSKDAE